MKEKTIKIKDVTADEYTKTLKKSMSEMKDGDALFVQYSGRGNSTRVEKISIPLKEKQPLLRRFRWPLFIALFASAQTAGLAYLYGDTHTAMIAFVVVAGVMCIAVVLNSIDESPKTIEDKYKD